MKPHQVVCISMYDEDVERVDAMVSELKARGFGRASRSGLIRVALRRLRIEDVPRDVGRVGG